MSACDFERKITFTIPGKSGVQATLTELPDGTILFEMETLGHNPADLRGLFFDINNSTLIEKLVFTGDDITNSLVGDGAIHDLGQGANINGHNNPKFDAGVRFGTPGIGKDEINSTSFILSTNDGTPLTLDDFVHVNFGARTTSIGQKLWTEAPAAPDAMDDVYTIFEDGQSSYDMPSHTPQGVLFEVLANDTDADNDKLTIIDFCGPEHGTLAIVDGGDPDLLPGDALLYTPDQDYAGPDSFEYLISDNNGGQDFATVDVTINAVADEPDVSIQAFATDNVNEIRLVVIASQTDADGSEFIDQIVPNGVPAGVTLTPTGVDPIGQPGTLVQEFLLTLPLDQDSNFDLTFNAISQEKSNGDQESNSATINIDYEYNSTTMQGEFNATNQSIWSDGDQFTFVDDRFLGVNTGEFNKSIGTGLYAGMSGHVQLGLQSTLTFEGGSIDAEADYDITVETNYNKTVDQLVIDTGAMFTGGSFNTEGPQGSYMLNFLYDILLQAYAGVAVDLGPLGSVGGQINFPAVGVGPGEFNLIDLTSDDLSGTIEFPPPLNAFSVNFDWPDIATNGASATSPIMSSGASNNFFELDLDLDTLVTQLLGLPNVFDPPAVNLGPIFADPDLLDVDIIGGFNFLQDFSLAMGDLSGMLMFEDGTSQAFALGDSVQLINASGIDAGGDGDGNVEFDLMVGPSAMLTNDTELGFNIGVDVALLSVEVGYDIGVASDSTTLGPLAEFGVVEPVASVQVYNDTFALNFHGDTFSFMA